MQRRRPRHTSAPTADAVTAHATPMHSNVATPAASSVAMSCDGDFSDAIAAIGNQESAAQLHAFAVACRQKEDVVRTPLVPLQLLALARQFTCLGSTPVVRSTAQRKLEAYGRAMQEHGQQITHSRTHSFRSPSSDVCVRPLVLLSVLHSLGVLCARAEAPVARAAGLAHLPDATTSTRRCCATGTNRAAEVHSLVSP